MQLTTPPPNRMISIMSFCLLNAGVLTIAHANTVGYILLMRRLYQLSKRPVLPMSRVKPEQKKNSTSPMLPPVANTEYLPYSNSMCELVMNSAARNFRISILTSRCLISSFSKYSFYPKGLKLYLQFVFYDLPQLLSNMSIILYSMVRVELQ